MPDNTNKIKHLEMIEEIIKRMASNSFAIKGWAVAIVSAIIAYGKDQTNWKYYITAFIPLFVLHCLDSFYLYIERKYLDLYEKVRMKKNTQIDFDMNTDYFNKDNKMKLYIKSFLSFSVMLFYPVLGLLVLVIMYINIMVK